MDEKATLESDIGSLNLKADKLSEELSAQSRKVNELSADVTSLSEKRAVLETTLIEKKLQVEASQDRLTELRHDLHVAKG